MSDTKRTLVEKRIAYIQKQMAKGRGVDVNFEGLTPQGSGPSNRDGMPKLPIGQHEVRNWPVLDLGHQPDIPREAFKLEVGGLVEEPRSFSFDELFALPRIEDTSDFHCVTTWSRYDNDWVGVRVRDVIAECVPKEEARYMVCTGSDRAPGTTVPYTTNLPLDRALEDDVLLVHTWEGQPLPREHGGPVRMITPKLYAWKGTKWIERIELVAEDEPGFWEVRGYSNSAEPWFNDRYSR